jgi:hypothetical protein
MKKNIYQKCKISTFLLWENGAIGLQKTSYFYLGF